MTSLRLRIQRLNSITEFRFLRFGQMKMQSPFPVRLTWMAPHPSKSNEVWSRLVMGIEQDVEVVDCIFIHEWCSVYLGCFVFRSSKSWNHEVELEFEDLESKPCSSPSM